MNRVHDQTEMNDVRLKFERPPLVEAVWEVRFANESGWNWTIPGRLHERIDKRYPVVKEVRPPSIVVGQQGAPHSSPSPSPMVEKLQFVSEDGTRLVQSGPSLLAVNILQPYPGWNEFLKEILDIFGLHAEFLTSTVTDRVGLRYINRIELDGSDAASLLKVLPALREFFDANASAFFERFEIPYDAPVGTLTYQAGTATGDARALMIDLDFWTGSLGKVGVEELGNWLTRAHARIEKSLARSLTREAVGLLGMQEVQ